MTTDVVYKRVPTGKTEPCPKEVGPVLWFPHIPSIEFLCPCGERVVYVTSPPHTIEFSEDELLTLDGSVGSRERPDLGRPPNWCHFFVRNGVPDICGDALCPGNRKES